MQLNEIGNTMKQTGITASELARMSGVSKMAISRYASGEPISTRSMLKLTKTLNAIDNTAPAVSMPSVIGGEPENWPSLMAELERRQTIGVIRYLPEVEIDPELARRMLRRNLGNRPVSPQWVRAYSRDMANGKWLLTGDTIDFTADGRLINGQHRLHAIINAKATIRVGVCVGVSEDAFFAKDCGKQQTPAETISVQRPHLRNAKKLATACRFLYSYELAMSGRDFTVAQHERLNSMATIEILDRYPGLDVSQRAACNAYTGIPGGSEGALIALHYLASKKASPQQVTEFFKKLQTGQNLSAGDPVLALRDRLISLAAGGKNQFYGSTGRTRFMSLLIRAWNAYRQNKRVIVLRESPGYPIPEII